MLQPFPGGTVRKVGGFAPLIFGAGLIGILWLGGSSDRMGDRRWHFAIPQITAALALSAWFFLPHSNALLIVVFTLIGFGTVAYLPSFWALPSAFLTRSAAAAAVGFINCTASIGGFFWPENIGGFSQQDGSFKRGILFFVCRWAGASVAGLFLPRGRAPR